MVSISEQRLAQLVDREGEIKNFCSMLDDSDWPRPVMVIWGEGGMGKSSLLFRMIHECSLRKITKAEVTWTDIYNHDFLAVMRKIRDDVGADKFSAFTKLVNYFFSDRSIRVDLRVDGAGTVGDGMAVGPNAQIGTMANVVFEKGSVVIKDQMETTPRGDVAINDTDRMVQITDQFISDLSAASANSRVVVFLDSTEKATDVTRRWFWSGLLEALNQGTLNNVQFVVCSRNQPMIDDRLKLLVDEERLGPLRQEHIAEYLSRLKIDLPAEAKALVVDTIWVTTQGNPLKIAESANKLSRMCMRGDNCCV